MSTLRGPQALRQPHLALPEHSYYDRCMQAISHNCRTAGSPLEDALRSWPKVAAFVPLRSLRPRASAAKWPLLADVPDTAASQGPSSHPDAILSLLIEHSRRTLSRVLIRGRTLAMLHSCCISVPKLLRSSCTRVSLVLRNLPRPSYEMHHNATKCNTFFRNHPICRPPSYGGTRAIGSQVRLAWPHFEHRER